MASIDAFRIKATQSSDPGVMLDFAKYINKVADQVVLNEVGPNEGDKVKNGLYNEAIKVVKRLATQGGFSRGAYAEAQFVLADCYNKGHLGLAPDHDKAFSLYQQSSKQSHPQGTYRTAVCYEMGAGTKKDPHRAVQYYRKAASLGDTGAMYKLGVVLLKGLLSQPVNPREGTTWLKRAADQADVENPHALHELALCYEKGGVPSILVDEHYAKELYTQAAHLGYEPSQFKLGFCYEYGTLACPQDARRSIAWYTRAAEQGDPEAELALSGWYLTGSDGILQQSDTEAYLWARKAADKGLAKAEYAIGYYTETGIGVKQDMEEARRWYMRSAAQGHKRAMNRLTELKRLGNTTSQRTKPSRSGNKDENCTIF
ncbi:HCP-like protein [Dimargaris cristalligena]|uniref:HCP-like protein n=1 Tax=Dimargaris cristalligena TaxID=215637 RepID=A0A4P9ZU62_9FUNG|nr:HCP-like protein [Dimargaris cristalligena]|eukprot:RKP36391.1 HCP-like protein [Dimargaris cristalligena]